MYKTYEKKEAIKEVQHYLSYISDEFVAPSGVYDAETRNEVIIIQEKHGLTPSGIVNKETYDIIYSEYLDKKAKNNVPCKINFPIEVASYSDEILEIKKMLITVTESLDIYHTLRPNGLYDNAADNAQKELSKIFRLDDEDFDEFFYNFLKKEYDFITKQKVCE